MNPILYGINIWGGMYPTYSQKLQILQNKAPQIITGSHYQAKAIQSTAS